MPQLLMQREEIINKINLMLIDEFEIEESQISPNARFKEDFDIDSLDFVDLVVIIEKNFGFKVKGEEMVNIKKLADFYNFIFDRIKLN